MRGFVAAIVWVVAVGEFQEAETGEVEWTLVPAGCMRPGSRPVSMSQTAICLSTFLIVSSAFMHSPMSPFLECMSMVVLLNARIGVLSSKRMTLWNIRGSSANGT